MGRLGDANRRWPDVLAERLQKEAVRGREVGVLNQGIIGNRLLSDSPPQMRDRFGDALYAAVTEQGCRRQSARWPADRASADGATGAKETCEAIPGGTRWSNGDTTTQR